MPFLSAVIVQRSSGTLNDALFDRGTDAHERLSPW
jgi:hypothetical protein